MTRFRLTIEFDGQSYMGWQRQPHGPSVQQAIEDACAAITGEEALVYGAGRTDSGVHALAMSAHVDIKREITAFRLGEALNAKLRGEAIAILDCEAVDDDWHARFGCTGRHYLYRIVNRRAPLALDDGRAWRIPQPLNEEMMQAAAQLLVGKHDFTTFRSAHCQAESPVKTLSALDVERIGDRLEVTASARSFLHHQVRSMVGCLALVGIGRWSVGDLKDALEATDRNRLGLNAPPDGLYFVCADYPEG
ncbi:tRNA pseudouridine(38-40) synthase TruA [Parasphingopyxis sp. CP4]|uniref:tRNA pseudouridine(38-40) synthase TruA n=1 Tax=Parasphingopyxis sp. CP4 TaxID=2724527 RepID=UPI0015A3578D|nr:tRNA pseudouridine(38-40) synthase TruA [Parasphingopyxis sp. CP4]QLC21420.1 tRNA pseudouridine(38-40) synthase TruA [Parasphingopyxis sp. CP4]